MDPNIYWAHLKKYDEKNPVTPTRTVMPSDSFKQQRSQYKPIDVDIQKKLNEMYAINSSKALPTVEDGKLGPKTQDLLDVFKKETGKEPTAANIYAEYYQNHAEKRRYDGSDPASPLQPGKNGLPDIHGPLTQTANPKA